MENNSEIATFAGGCFWCTEAIFQRIKGVKTVMSGYTGGDLENPSYWDVTSRKTGHTEAIQVTFDPSIISYETLLEVFFALHDPTSLNQQGADVGPEYRSAIFYHDESQKKVAENMIENLHKSGKYREAIVTEIVPLKKFYKAEESNQNFYNKDPNNMYCKVVIDPKIRKLMITFKNIASEKPVTVDEES